MPFLQVLFSKNRNLFTKNGKCWELSTKAQKLPKALTSKQKCGKIIVIV